MLKPGSPVYAGQHCCADLDSQLGSWLPRNGQLWGMKGWMPFALAGAQVLRVGKVAAQRAGGPPRGSDRCWTTGGARRVPPADLLQPRGQQPMPIPALHQQRRLTW